MWNGRQLKLWKCLASMSCPVFVFLFWPWPAFSPANPCIGLPNMVACTSTSAHSAALFHVENKATSACGSHVWLVILALSNCDSGRAKILTLAQVLSLLYLREFAGRFSLSLVFIIPRLFSRVFPSVVNASCVDNRVISAVQALRPQCWTHCPFPKNRTTSCYLDCLFQTLVGNVSMGIKPMSRGEIVAPFEEAFLPVAKGGCPAVWNEIYWPCQTVCNYVNLKILCFTLSLKTIL